MTILATQPVQNTIDLCEQQHIVLEDISWAGYEAFLAEIGDRMIRLTYDDGWLEIMAPLSQHEWAKGKIGQLLELMCLERNISVLSGGSTTFRREERHGGLEPDECFFIASESRVRSVKKWNAQVDPPPDLAIEIDITRRSVAREPIYAKLRVPELWRYDGARLTVRILQSNGEYHTSETSLSFPFLPIQKFVNFLNRFEAEEPNTVLRDFQSWVRTLA